jgi:predicted NAD/FAD-binding protein
VGGHTHTVDVNVGGEPFAVDTGFIVHNAWTYPNFIALLEELQVPWQKSDMSFSVRCERTGLEYNGTSLNALFAQRRNLVSPSFLRMVGDILRFNRRARALLATDAPGSTLSEFLSEGGYGRHFIEHYIVPMGAAIWSSRPCDMFNFPARFFLQFFSNHGFLSVDDRPVWRVIRGGSREYVKALTHRFADRIRLNCPVKSIQRQPGRVLVRAAGQETESFDQVFIACHSDQALALLADPSPGEREILGAIRYQENEAVLHTDTRLMPRAALAWAAWNYHLTEESSERATVTYNMNMLQSLSASKTLLLSLNRGGSIDPSTVIDQFVYHHPVFTPAAIAAQRRCADISGQRRTFYLGAYWGYGFHEDGVNSALSALSEFERQQHAQPHLQRVG